MSAEPVPMLGPKTVTITVDKNGITVTPPEIEINRLLGESIQWECNVPQFLICFGQRTPFDSYHFHERSPMSGRVNGAAKSGPYKYSIECPGVPPLDPTVIVRP
jgi:hypothetical protein